MAKVFSGIQPTGFLTIGNYLGAIKNWLTLQDEHDCIYCIVDLHAITLPQDPKDLRNACIRNFAMYIASGLDPQKSIIFTQSAVPHHSELSWIFSCITPMGWLNRMTQFKEKSGKHKEMASLGLYAYPTLMAADILLYDTTLVPVGEDQTQHVELTRDIAGAFNRQFNVDFFKEPDVLMVEVGTRIMSLRDGTKKMSKSDESDFSRINMTDDADLISQKFKKAKTDAIEGIYFDKENRPEVSNLLNIYSAFSGKKVADIENDYRSAPTSKFKTDLADVVIGELSTIQNRFNELIKDEGELYRLSKLGSDRAAEIAESRMKKIREIVGLYS